MKKFLQILFIILLPIIIIFTIISVWEPDNLRDPFDNETIKLSQVTDIPVNHNQFPELKQDFDSVEQVTKACLQCHNNIDEQLMLNEHWNWKKLDTIPGRGNFEMGKENILNNFCIGASSNEKLCTKCHAGYGYTRNTFDSTATQNMDCIVCHDGTGTYLKGKDPGYGLPPASVDLSYVAQNVGSPQRKNCGLCHYFGGGSNNAKHGDLDVVLNACSRDIDVHMDKNGLNFACIDCHSTENHNIPGNLPMVSSSPSNTISCTDCHTGAPHKSRLLNDHYTQVACQTCHIPVYAKDAPTKIYWDWSDAGQLDADGNLLDSAIEISADTTIHYDSKHGSITYAKNLTPEYMWYNGYTDHHFIEDSIMSDTVYLTSLFGSYDDNIHPMDPQNPSKIYPFKVMRGKQPYDPINKTLIQLNTIGGKGSGAFWADFDWQAAINNGMDCVNMPYSGQYDFIYTESHWPIAHMVSPAENALTCEQCHVNKGGVLDNLTGFYLPGRDRSKFIEIAGIIFIILSIVGVSTHATLRIINRKNCN
ncbi:MAG: tetrathionate reductase family octaheme c-type cytochrome [Bacteroidales bacterium]|nr:tetrathionate reductase family octaheme c-type cytochrome [Bacteroidales bacterium]